MVWGAIILTVTQEVTVSVSGPPEQNGFKGLKKMLLHFVALYVNLCSFCHVPVIYNNEDRCAVLVKVEAQFKC